MSAELQFSPGTNQPVAVGRFLDRQARKTSLPFSAQEVERSTLAIAKRLGSFHFRTGNQFLMISVYDECAQFSPLERALHEQGLVMIPADAVVFDAARSETILRRFDISAVVGINGAVLDGLEANGHDPKVLLSGKLVWARPCAYERLKGVNEVTLLRWIDLGPTVALECAHGGGAHICQIEWDVVSNDGEILLTSRLERALDFHNYATGMLGELRLSACACGSSDPRLVPAD